MSETYSKMSLKPKFKHIMDGTRITSLYKIFNMILLYFKLILLGSLHNLKIEQTF